MISRLNASHKILHFFYDLVVWIAITWLPLINNTTMSKQQPTDMDFVTLLSYLKICVPASNDLERTHCSHYKLFLEYFRPQLSQMTMFCPLPFQGKLRDRLFGLHLLFQSMWDISCEQDMMRFGHCTSKPCWICSWCAVKPLQCWKLC